MSKLLEEAFAQAAKLPESEQDALAAWLLAEMSSEREWDAIFRRSENVLSELADEALSEHRHKETEELVPKNL